MKTGKRVIGILLLLFLLQVRFIALAETSPEGRYIIISNESVSQTQYSGTFQMKGKKGPYQMDAKKPFDLLKNKKNTIRKSTYSISSSYQQGDSKSFWVTDFSTYKDYQINATLKYSGNKVNVWVHDNQISSQNAVKLGSEFDTDIRPLIEQYFGKESDVNSDGKINILCYDIQDGFSGYGGYIGGYFYGGDLFNELHSNQSEIFYIDTYPLMGVSSTKDVTASYDTLVHEFQHMVNFNQNVFVEGSYTQMDVWLDEALSMAAEQIYTGDVLSDRIEYYNSASSITNGLSLLDWDNSNDVLANYSLSYLFGQYMKVQANQGNKIFKEIINHPYNDYRAVQTSINKYINSTMSFGQFMTTFRGALLLNQPSGLYGFKGDPSFDSIQKKIYTGSSKNLVGGGAVVKQISEGEAFSIPSDKGTNVTYTMVTPEGDKVAPSSPIVNPVSDNQKKVTGKTEVNAKVFVKSGSTVIGSGQAGINGDFNVTIPLQKAGTKLVVIAEDLFGNQSIGKTITVLDKTAPVNAVVNQVSNKDTKVTGKTEANATVYVTSGTVQLGNAKADSVGSFSVPITVQKAGTKLLIQAKDVAGNKNSGVSITVIDKIAPAKPIVNAVGDNQLTVTGKAEAGATVYVKVGTKILGQAISNSSNSFSVSLPAKQKKGTVLTVLAKDKAGNMSSSTSVTVLDKTSPSPPVVAEVKDNSKVVTGKGEVGAKVIVKQGSTIVGTGKIDTYGKFTLEMNSIKKAGTTLYVTLTDAAGNVSSATKATVKDRTPPALPSVNTVTTRSTSISGKAEANAYVFVKVGTKVIVSTKANQYGTFAAAMSKQKSGTVLSVYAKDASGNVGKLLKVTVR
ncbi:Neutral metalloprotease precursor [Mycobacteroides abscessus subsp. abscessus]|nr:Neutral metalloprotease precursor [Mycobacteroides abscessus subsp. abscessus]